MKSTILAFILTASFTPITQAASVNPQDAYGYCYHFYNCTGNRVSEGYYSTSECRDAGGLSVQEGTYCENIANPITAVRQPLFYGECFYSIGCIGGSAGQQDEQACRNLGGHSLLTGGACIQL